MYATLDDLLARYPEKELVQLTDDEGSGTIDTARVDAAIASADTIVNGYLAFKYRTDGTPVPQLLVELGGDIAWFKLHTRRGAAPDRVKEGYKEAIATLEKIQSGKVKLDAGVETLAARPGAVLVSKPTRLFGRNDMAGF